MADVQAEGQGRGGKQEEGAGGKVAITLYVRGEGFERHCELEGTFVDSDPSDIQRFISVVSGLAEGEVVLRFRLPGDRQNKVGHASTVA